MRVLLADDSGFILERLHEMLNPFEEVEIIDSLKNGTDALASIKQNKPDLAIVDLKMPGLTGLEVLKKIRTQDKKLKFIILTFYTDDHYRKIAFEEGVDYFFSKVDDFDKIAPVIRDFIAQDNNSKRNLLACV